MHRAFGLTFLVSIVHLSMISGSHKVYVMNTFLTVVYSERNRSSTSWPVQQQKPRKGPGGLHLLGAPGIARVRSHRRW